ncbi:MAG: sugar ABC transporter substrate-binding protein [Clostridia bacterium]|nr:sugar ABC transporter substrate-binding protein [Clostridia bacterium]
MKKVLCFMMVLCLALAAIGCAAPAAEEVVEEVVEEVAEEVVEEAAEEKLTFALLPKTLTNEYFVAMKDKAQAACDALGVELLYDAPTEETMINEQIAMFETMMEKGVDGILVVPNGTDEIVASVEAANAAGIPVICLDTNANGGEILSFIGTNNYEGGVLAGKWIGDNFEGKVAVITGVPGNQCHTDRTQGFIDGIADYAAIELAAEPVPGYCERAQGMTCAENLITAHPDLVAIYCCNDQMAMGAGEAVKAAGLSEQIAVVGFDGSPDCAQGIIDGLCAASVAQAPGRMAELGVNAMYEYIVNGTQPEAVVDTGCTICFADNAEEYLTWH